MKQEPLSVFVIESTSYVWDILRSVIGESFKLIHLKEEAEVVSRLDIKSADRKIVLLDITDIEISGLSLLETLNTKKRTDISVIVVSHSGEPVDIDQALRLGAEDYIIKEHFTSEELVAKIKRAASKIELSSISTTETMNLDSGKTIDPTNINLLIVEDDQFLRDLSSRKLKQEGFNVDVAIDGNEGLKKIESQKPDVVLLDIILPGIDGFDILQRIRSSKNEAVRNGVVILLSNLGQEADVAKGERLGADDYLIKANFTIDEIIEKIRVALSKKQSGKIS